MLLSNLAAFQAERVYHKANSPGLNSRTGFTTELIRTPVYDQENKMLRHLHHISSKLSNATGAIALIGGLATINNTQAQSDFNAVQIKTIQITDRIYMLEGMGGNIGLTVSDDGVFMIDDQFAPLSNKILAAVKTISDKPLSYLVNTHWHGDHSGGNANMARHGAIITAHDNVYKRLSETQYNQLFKQENPAAPASARPKITYSDTMSFYINDERVDLVYIKNAHTDGDSVVHFTGSNVIHAGDLFFSGYYPFIDTSSGGSLEGYIAGMKKVMALCDDKTKIIPGHGPASGKADLKADLEVLELARDRIAQLVADGKTLEQVLAAKPMADYDKQYGGFFINPETFLTILYGELSP